ncbi:hypothetical protein [Vallicoccus soli]|uniref:Uncharacterized protein n=1 Tax=Vallicoccus soli TaxID=2339232 RepID=A0A3A3Z3K0_9ACTN|nr:hypothetical protein [Vallicoccus soli]RJK97992.1 hypothetical protein D5H78_03270 [Vallicoccus soli]
MPFVVEYVPWTGRAPERVEALDVVRAGPHLEFTDYRLVVGAPRAVVALRVPAREVAAVRRVPGERGTMEG